MVTVKWELSTDKVTMVGKTGCRVGPCPCSCPNCGMCSGVCDVLTGTISMCGTLTMPMWVFILWSGASRLENYIKSATSKKESGSQLYSQ